MPFPASRDGLIEAGYKFHEHACCRGCKAEIEWWETRNAKKMPFNLMPEPGSPAIVHFTTCPNADEFRRRRP